MAHFAKINCKKSSSW